MALKRGIASDSTRHLVLLALLAATVSVRGDMLPGVRVELVANTSGFLTSIALDASGAMFYSTREGGIFRLHSGQSVSVANVDTVNDGNPYSNAGLLGIVFDSAGTLLAHWVSTDISADVIGSIDVETGRVVELHRLSCNERRPCSTEHHGGNLTRAPDGSVFFGLGDFFLAAIHPQNPSSPGGKIHRIGADGVRSVFAAGVRNPFDMAWDSATNKLVVADNGTGRESDEINLVSQGDNLGWPITAIDPQAPGMTAPIYIFEDIVAPTGVSSVERLGSYTSGGVLVASYVTQSIYYFPDLAPRPLPAPITILDTRRRETVSPSHVTVPADAPIIDVVSTHSGELYFATPDRIFAVSFPQPGDVDGDGAISRADLQMLRDEITEAAGERTYEAQNGAVRSTWGADVDQNGTIDDRDLAEFLQRFPSRKRSVRR